MSEMRPAITDVGDDRLARWLAEQGQPAYRLRQIRRSVARSTASDWSGLTDLPLGLRAKLADAFRWSSVELETEVASADGETRKALLRLHDGHHVESVLMPHHGARNSACISTQAGCPMACAFCATGEMGLIRDLTAGEIVDQVRHWQRELRAHKTERGSGSAGPSGTASSGALSAARRPTDIGQDRVSHVVYMGMGEPLRNYGPVMASVRALVDPDLFGISPRRITISTCGIVPKMDALAAEGLPINLAVSLHSADDRTRTRIMPVNRKWGVDDVLDASARYVERTKRRLTFEHILLAGVNDDLADAERLARRIKSARGAGGGQSPPPSAYHVNLIPVNPGPGGFERPAPERMERFARVLEGHGIAATVRISKGQDIQAGCGQLKVREGRASEDPALPA